MKPSDHTSIGWMQQRQRFLAYLKTRDMGEPGQQRQGQAGPEAARPGAERRSVAEYRNTALPR